MAVEREGNSTVAGPPVTGQQDTSALNHSCLESSVVRCSFVCFVFAKLTLKFSKATISLMTLCNNSNNNNNNDENDNKMSARVLTSNI